MQRWKGDLSKYGTTDTYDSENDEKKLRKIKTTVTDYYSALAARLFGLVDIMNRQSNANCYVS